MSLLGIDVGTTGCKAAAYGLDGRCLATAYREYPTLHPRPGWDVLESGQVVEAVWAVIREVAARTAADPITALSVSSMGEAVAPVTRDRRLLGESILCSDVRGQEYIDGLLTIYDPASFYAINPNPLGINYTMPKLCWLRDHQPALFEETELFLPWGDLICFLLGCEPRVSYSLANRTLLFDITTERWSQPVLDACGLPGEKLPPLCPSGAVLGTVSAEMARQLGLPGGVAVVSGGHDQGCNALGAGITRAGRAVYGMGTYACITPVYGQLPALAMMRAQGLNIEHHILPGLYVSFLYNQSGSLVRWFRDTFAKAEKAAGGDLYERLTAEMPADPTALFVLPYFEPTGSPGFIANASGAILGLTTGTTRGEILKGIMEGATLYFVDSLRALAAQGIDTSEFVATGGGAKSDAWLQLSADIFGVPLTRPRVTEAGTLGAAMLAGIATGAFTSADDAAACFVHQDRTFDPHPGRHARYRDKAELYRTLFPVLRPTLEWRVAKG